MTELGVIRPSNVFNEQPAQLGCRLDRRQLPTIRAYCGHGTQPTIYATKKLWPILITLKTVLQKFSQALPAVKN